MKTAPMTTLKDNLQYLKLDAILAGYEAEIADAARRSRTPLEVFERLIAMEADARYERAIQRRLHAARLPVVKTLDQFDWTFPKKINQDLVRNLFRLQFIEEKHNVVFISNTGLGKTHLAIALAYEACRHNQSVLFTTAVDIINTLSCPPPTVSLAKLIHRYTAPALLICDELGYLPIDRKGADLLFQVISGRYERGSTVFTTNRVFKDWAKTFNNDSVVTSAILDRVLHHCEVVLIQGHGQTPSYRTKGLQENA
jgi:DNA replication protein DnaC